MLDRVRHEIENALDDDKATSATRVTAAKGLLDLIGALVEAERVGNRPTAVLSVLGPCPLEPTRES